MIEDIAHDIENGNPFVWIGDIKACYRSVNFDAVYSLALLPEPIVTNHLDIRNMQLTGPGANRRYARTTPCNNRNRGETRNSPIFGSQYHRAQHTDRLDHARPIWPKGLMEGGSASNALLVALYNDFIRNWPEHLPAPYVMSDNFAFVGPTRETVQMAAEHLASGLANHLAGPFYLHQQLLCNACEEFEMLGYAMKLEGKQIAIDLSHSNHERVWGELNDLEQELPPEELDLVEFLRRRLAGFPALTPNNKQRLRELVMEFHPRDVIRTAEEHEAIHPMDDSVPW